MYEQEVQAIVRATRQDGPSAVEVRTVELFATFPTPISQSTAHEIWIQMVSKMGLSTSA